MAKMKLGLLVTAIAGKLGGNSFRNGPNGLIAQKPTRGNSKSKLALNQNLAQQSFFTKQWNFFSNSLKADWEVASGKFAFPDKFDKMRYLSGRSLYLKLQSQLAICDNSSIAPGQINSVLPKYSSYDLDFDLSSNLEITFNNNSIFGYTLLQIQYLANAETKGKSKRSKFLAFIDNSVTDTIDFTTAFDTRFPYAEKDDKFLFTVTQMNYFGFRSTPQSFITTLENVVSFDVVNLYASAFAYIVLDGYFYDADFEIETNVYFKQIPPNVFLFVGSNVFLRIRSNNANELKVASFITTFNIAGGLILDKLYNFRVQRISNIVYFYIDNVLILSASASGIIVINSMGGTTSDRVDFSQSSFRIGTDYYAVNEMSGSVIASSGVKTANIITSEPVNSLWETIVLP